MIAAAYDVDGDGALDLAVVDETPVKVVRYCSGRTSSERPARGGDGLHQT